MERVIAYVDGFNLYFGLRERRWRRFYWLDIHALANALLKDNQSLVSAKYFTSVVHHPPDKHRRQATHLEALGTLDGVELFFGKYLDNIHRCRNCGHEYVSHHEKMTGVNIAVEMLTDATTNRFDVALLVSADSDLVGAVRRILDIFPKKRVVAVFPPKRSSKDLAKSANHKLYLSKSVLARSLFPPEVPKKDGFVLRRPELWR